MPRHNEIENPAVYCLKITLKGIRPPIWRRFRVANDITLNRLHGASGLRRLPCCTDRGGDLAPRIGET